MITCNCNTSYSDTLNISPIERTYLLEFISDDLKKKKDLMDKVKSKTTQ